jgi:site-specific DNA recombinase
MSPVWAVSKGKRYFYYDCTSVQHRGRGVCSVRSINAEVLEGLVLERIEEIAQNEVLLMRLVSKASGEASFKVKDLEEKRVLLKLRIKELEKKGSLLANKLIEIEGKSAERFILKEIEAVDNRLKELEEELKRVEFDIERWSDYVLNAEIIRDSFHYFSRIFPQLSPQEKKSLIRLLVKEVIFSNEEVVIDFFEVPEEELKLESIQKVGFDQPFNWLPKDRALRNFKDILKVEVVKGKGHPHRLKVLAP